MTADLKRNEQQLAKDVNGFMTTEVPAELVSKMPADHQQNYKALRQAKWTELNVKRRAKAIEASYQQISTVPRSCTTHARYLMSLAAGGICCCETGEES